MGYAEFRGSSLGILVGCKLGEVNLVFDVKLAVLLRVEQGRIEG